MTTKTIAASPLKNAHGYVARITRHGRLVLDVVASLVVMLALVSVVVQFLYPFDRALPFMRMGGLDVGFKTARVLEKQLTDYAQQGQVTLVTPSGQWREKWQAVGMSIDPQASVAAALQYEPWERAIPFSAVAKIIQAHERPLIALADPDRLAGFADQLVEKDKLAAVDATIKVAAGQVVIDEAKNGYAFTTGDVKRQIQQAPVTTESRLELQPTTVPPVRPAQALAHAKEQAEAALGHTLSITVGDKKFTPSREVIGGWLGFTAATDAKTVSMVVNPEAVQKYLESINKDIGIGPGTATVTLLDGQEVGRTAAASGKSLAVDSSVKVLVAALGAKQTRQTVPLVMADVPPTLHYERQYSQSSSGLQAIINDWDQNNRGDFAVLVRELGGERRYADIQPDKHFVTASTYKLFVYYSLQQRIQAGQLKYSDKNDLNWTVEDCIEEMIVHSTNPCAISFMSLLGWQTVQDYTTAAGFSNTLVNNFNGGEKHSTVRDETNYMLRLNAGTLMGEEATGRLLGYLKRQIWRGGIPSGVPRGVVVADKVGFYNNWRHDIAVVYAPRGTYILGVMSYGGSDAQFADLSRRVYAFFNN